MKTRLKTYGEFMKAITIVQGVHGGVKLICNKPYQYVLLETHVKPWNSKETRKSFLVRLYIKNIIWKMNVSKFIQRIEGFELLGRRVMHGEQVAVIVNAQEGVNQETGEAVTMLTITTMHSTTPIKILSTLIQL